MEDSFLGKTVYGHSELTGRDISGQIVGTFARTEFSIWSLLFGNETTLVLIVRTPENFIDEIAVEKPLDLH